MNNNDLNLPCKTMITDLQRYVHQLEEVRGFSRQDVIQKCLLLGEEIGELFKAVRKVQGLNIDCNANVTSVADELADILIYVCAIANRYAIDLEEALRQKEEVNKRRTWGQVSQQP